MSRYDDLGLTDEQRRIADEYSNLPATVDVLQRIDQFERELDRTRADLTFRPQRRQVLHNDLEQAQARLLKAQERDAIQATRPEGCWCLGVGGSQPTSTRLGEKRWHYFEKYCNCPDGVARRELDRPLRQEAWMAKAKRRADDFRATLPQRFQYFTLATYPQTTEAQKNVVKRLQAWVADECSDDPEEPGADWGTNRWLLLHGPYGTGKTGLAGAVGAALLETRMVDSVHMAAVPRLLDRVRATYNRQSKENETEADVMEELFDVECLILDDLGAERATDWVAEKLFTLINHRHDEELMTIITTNLAPSELGAHIGERTMWRIAELSFVVSLEGCPNLRLPKPKRPRLEVVNA
jgi:DNA replication protein DnaC